MKFCYYSKKNADDVRFFTIQTNSDDEMLRINTVSEEFGIELVPEACCKYGFEYCYAVIDSSITNIQIARKRYNQIKEAVESLSEDEIIQRFYFTDEDGNEVWEDFGTLDDARRTAKELANKYHQYIHINTVINEEIVDSESPDEETETAETAEECEAETVEATEICPEFETEVRVESSTYKAECPVCHRKLMLCGICRTAHAGDCDYDTSTDTCRFDSS